MNINYNPVSPLSISFEEYDLENGLHIILHQDHSIPLVAVSVMYHVGSKNENPNLTGFAHFFEHLLFEGTENIPRGQFDKIVYNAGGKMNANTSQDRTFYYELFPANHLETGLWLESERMMHAKIDDKGIETQRQVVKEERMQRYDNQPYGTLIEEGVKRAFTDHPYQWMPIGSMAHIDAATTEDFTAFYRGFYRPDNAVLCLAGDFDAKNAKELIEKYFGGIPTGQHPVYRPEIVEPPMKQEVRDTIYDNVTLPAVVQLYHMPPPLTKDYFAVRLLINLLSNGDSSRLHRKLVDQMEVAIQVGAFAHRTEDPGVAVIFAIGQVETDVNKLEADMEEELDRLRHNLISGQELQKVKNQVESNAVYEFSSLVSIAESLSTAYTYYKNTHYANERLSHYIEVTEADILRVAQTYFDSGKRVLMHWLPKK